MKIGSDLVASWKDDKSTSCTITITFTGKDGITKAANSGDKLEEEGKLVVAVSDDSQNKASAEITLLAEAVYGLEGLQQLSLQVDKEVNLLQGITFADGVSLDKVEIEAPGNRAVVQDPNHYLPETPGTIAIIITVKVGERALEFRVDNLEVKGLDYNAPAMITFNLIDERYPWYRVFNPRLNGTKNEFIYPHILVSYVALAWYKVENLEYIIATEVPEETPCEDVGSDQDE